MSEIRPERFTATDDEFIVTPPINRTGGAQDEDADPSSIVDEDGEEDTDA